MDIAYILIFLLSLVLLILPTNIPKIFAHTSEYLHGFQSGLTTQNMTGCDMYLKRVPAPGTITGWDNLSTSQYVHCLTGFQYAEHQIVITTSEYKAGFQLGKHDSYLGINDVDNACKNFVVVGNGNWGPNFFCSSGYDIANSKHFKMTPSAAAAISAFHQTLPYRMGFKSGIENRVEVCNQFNGLRDSTICNKAFQDGFNNNIAIWKKTDSFKHGFKLGVEDARMGITPDSVGACDSYQGSAENFTSAENLCESGYEHGIASYH